LPPQHDHESGGQEFESHRARHFRTKGHSGWNRPAAHHQPFENCPSANDADFRVVHFDLIECRLGFRQTKSTLDNEERRTKENQKIACGHKHFDTIGVDYDVVTSLAEVAF
jgi:hypothetical protein